jgi:GT2 family glycosyltransferase
VKECDLSIIIVSYNTRELLLACLESVKQTASDLAVEVWVVDNASTDGSVEAVWVAYPDVYLVANQENVGFAHANNQVLRQAGGKTLVLLNPDTRLLPGALVALQTAFEQDARIGMVGPQLLNADGTIQPSCGVFASAWTEFIFQSFLYKIFPSPFPLGDQINPLQRRAYAQPRRVDWVTGACLALRRDVLEQVGLLDESFFMYGEDMEWCWRAGRTGFGVQYQPAARVVHYSRQSSRRDYRSWIGRYNRGQLRFIQRAHGAFEMRISGLWICLGSLLRMVLLSAIFAARPSGRLESRQRLAGYRDAFSMGLQALVKRTV